MEWNFINYLSNMDQNSKFLLIIIGVISVLLVLIIILNILSGRKQRLHKKLIRNNNKKLAREIEEASKNITIEKSKTTVKKDKEVTIPVKEVSVEPKVQLSNVVEPEIEQEEIIEVLQDEDESDVDRILRDIKEASKEETMNLTEFEKEQEETAIISYDELCKRAGVKKKVYKTSNEMEYVEPKSTEKTKYTPSKIVSPIYGVQEEKKSFINITSNDNEEDLDKTFLKNLKEFRNGLE